MGMRLPNGFGSVYKLSGKRRNPYAAVLTDGMDEEGKYRRHYLGYAKTKKEAMSMLAEYHNKPMNIVDRSITMLEIWERWKQHRIDNGKSFPDNYKATKKHLSELHNAKFIDIRPMELQKIISSLNPPSARIMKTVLNMIYDYAKYIDILQVDYADALEMKPLEKSEIHKPFTDDEIDELEQCTDNIAEFALVSIYTGMRPSEIVLMKSKNVHIEKRYMVGGIKTDYGRGRSIPIHRRIEPIIKKWYNLGKPIISPYRTYRTMKAAWNASDIPAIRNHLPHDGRHTCTTKLDDAGTNKKVQQLILGHTSGDLEERIYTHKTIEQLIAAIDKI